MRMQNTIINNPAATCMLVEVIASRSQDIPWVITLDKKKQPASQKIRRVSIDKFYELVTGNSNAFKELCNVLPVVIADVVAEMKAVEKKNTVFAELKDISEDLLSSIYLLSFKHYEGFKNFKFK